MTGRNRPFGPSPHPGPAGRTCWAGPVAMGKACTSHKLSASFCWLHEAIALSLHHLTEQEGNSLHLLPLRFIWSEGVDQYGGTGKFGACPPRTLPWTTICVDLIPTQLCFSWWPGSLQPLRHMVERKEQQF